MIFLKYLRIISLLVIVSFLSACSNKLANNNVSTLQSDLDAYQYSDYVKANLKPEVVNVESKNNTDKSLNSSINTQKVALAKRQLSNSKKQSSNNIANTISNNGLYKTTSKGNEKILMSLASLDNVLALALQNNLDIKSAKEQVSASLAKYDLVEFLEDMLNQYAAFTQTKKPPQFPLPGLLSLKSSIIDQSVETQRLRLKQKVQDVITLTRLSYYDLQFTRAEIKLIKQDIGLLKSLKKELQNNYSSNTGDLDEVLQVDIDLATSRNNLQTAKDRLNSQQVRLNTLLNRSSNLTLGQLDKIKTLNVKLPLENAKYIKQAKENRIEIAVLSSELAQMEKVIQLSQRNLYPNLDSGFSVLKNGKFSTKPKIKTNKVLAKDDAYLTETKAKMKALKSKIAALKVKTANDVQQYLTGQQIAQKTHKLYQSKVIPKSKVAQEIADNMYETGETNYASVLKAKKATLKYRLESLNAQHKVVVNKTKLDRITSIRN